MNPFLQSRLDRCQWSFALTALLVLVAGSSVRAQSSVRSPYPEQLRVIPRLEQPAPVRPLNNGHRPFGAGPLRTMREMSLVHIDVPEPREIRVHDIITVIVDEKSQVSVKSRFNRQRNGTLKAELKEFIRLNNSGNLTGAAANSPTIDANLQNRFQANGEITDSEGIQYRIAAVVVDVRPNGNLVLEARKSIRSNRDVWEYRLTGIVRAEDVKKDNTIRSDTVANLQIDKRQRGKVFDSTKRAWGTLIYDVIFPF